VVTIENIGEWLSTCAVAAGIGSELLDKKAIEAGQFGVLTKKAQTLIPYGPLQEITTDGNAVEATLRLDILGGKL
jgi:hypothetical protein